MLYYCFLILLLYNKKLYILHLNIYLYVSIYIKKQNLYLFIVVKVKVNS